MGVNRSLISLWLVPLVLTIALSVTLLFFGQLGDLLFSQRSGASIFSNWNFLQDQSISRMVIISMLEVLAGIFAISITVVAIIVQLSATRYTSRVVDLFLADPFNILIFFAYIVPIVYGFWLSYGMHPDGFSPVSVGIFMVCSTLSIIVVIPYFKFVFYFLQPKHIIDTIERSIERTLTLATRSQTLPEKGRQDISNSIRQLSDIALASIAQSDILLAMQCVHSIKTVAVHYLRIKSQLPEAWHQIDREHIVGISEEIWQDMVARHTWMEMEIYKQYEIAFTSSLRKVRDINGFVASNLREIAATAAEQGRGETVDLMIKAFNTFVMYALSERDIRSAVHVLYQYRLLGEAVINQPNLLKTIGGHMAYYAHNSQRRRIFFIMDAVCSDVRTLVELSHQHHPESRDALMEIFLDLGKNGEAKDDGSLRQGPRKSQAMLAAYFIHHGRLDLAGELLHLFKQETPEFVQALRDALLRNQTREFWEIEDRGVSFFYVEAELREAVQSFFSWVLEEQPLPEELARSA